ncbi:chromate transporter [Breznakiella homolactica]|uniref:Chromate transporter n=1 Tax=Breznakiella homolactica TaxID=2798577 RepID=A0A7T7XNF8_9SPIR|nr:chromate transporter [Breznakiella homolactica]QQO09477.1 chromate transporter [Breznakiella homolactica]
MILLLLFAEFFKIGLFSIGGGLATLPFLYQLADKYDWLTPEIIVDMIAVSEATPGAIGVNMATYTGYQCAGIPGAVIATLGLICPSIIIILIVARILQAFKENRIVKSVFSGLRPAATGLIAAAGFGVITLSLYNPSFSEWYEIIRWKECLLFAVLFFLIYKFKKHPIVYIVAAGVAGGLAGL